MLFSRFCLVVNSSNLKNQSLEQALELVVRLDQQGAGGETGLAGSWWCDWISRELVVRLDQQGAGGVTGSAGSWW